ncbi:MAG: ribosomal-protein-alanine N-acetyltransferase [Sphingobacteriales bacterium]|jgi:ribosomal-protein-alanine N-acetyltransferase
MNFLLTDQETNRLKFRILTMQDFETWLPLFKEKDVAKFLAMDPGLSEHELCEKWFEKSMHRYENELGGMNVMIDKNTNEFIGQCGLLIQKIENIDRLEIGYSILPKFWGKGYASEAAIKCKNFAFESRFSESLISMVHIENIGSEIVAKRNGMTVERRIDDSNIFSIDQKQWEFQKEI